MIQRFLRPHAVRELTGLATSTIYEKMAQGQFPRPVRIGPRAVAWIEEEVADWQRARIDERDAGKPRPKA